MCNEGKPQKMQPCITLSESLNTKVFDEKNQVHQKQFNRVIEEIEGTIKEIEESQNATTYERRQNTISIIGSRGSGKSSFVHSILNKYENSNKVAVLPMIDPTLMEQKGHIFLVIIAQIKKMVEYKLNMKDCNPESANMSERKDWRAKLEKLSQGLPTINGIGHPHEESWEDADYIMDRGISAVQAASDLEKNFTELVEYGLKILDKKAFLLALDDIDLDFQKGWPVLETLRKYITTPQIITLLSGDMELFDKAVRKMQWKNFGKALLINEGERLKRIEEYDNHVTQLSEQYLLKVIQPAHRYVLDTLWGKYQKKEYVNIRYGSNKDNKEATCYYKMVLKDEFGIKDGEEAKTYYAYLMNLPLRTQIQLLYALHKKEGKDKERISIEAIYSPFLGELSIQKIDIHLATSTPTLFNVELLRFLLLKANILGSSYQLEPSRAEESYNACLTVFSLLLSELVKTNPFLIFDYFLKIGYVCNLASFIGYKRDKNESGLSIEGLCMHAAIYQDINLRNAAACIAAYLKAFTDRASKGKGLIEKDFYYGIIKLSGLQERARRDLTDRIDFVLKNEQDKIITLIGYMPFSIALPVNGIQTVQYSIYTLLATIGELLKIGFYSAEELSDLNEEEKGKKEKDIKEQIGKAILSLSQPRTYPMPHNKQGIDYESTNTPDSDPKFGDLTNEPSVLANWIFDWIGNYPVELKIAPYVLGKAITRFFYTLRDIEGTDKSNNLGDAMHRRVIAFFHAILLEDAKGNLDIEELNNLKLHHINPVTKDDDFTHNLNKLRKQSMQKNEETGEGQNNNNKKDDQNKVPNKEAISFPEVLSFSEWILKCPLLQIFVKSEISLPVINDEVRKHCVYDTLKKVSLPKSDVRDSYTDEQIINCIRSFGKDITYKECKNIAESKEKVHNHPLVNRVKEITKKIDKPIKNVTDLRTFIEQVDSSTDKTVAAWREAEDKKK